MRQSVPAKETSGHLPGEKMVRKAILLVEDDAPFRGVMRDMLQRWNYDVLEACDYAEALQFISMDFDLAIIDHRLPRHDGLELVKPIREMKPAVPVVLVTGYSTEDLAIRAVRAGVTDYIRKPFSFSLLSQRVAGLLGGETSAHHVNGEKRGDPVIEAIGLYAHEHYMEDLCLDHVAHRAGMSKFKFCRLFKERFGVCFVSYLNAARVKNAMELLRNPKLSVKEIAYFVGFRTVVHFDRVFKDINGISPREFRSRIKQSDSESGHSDQTTP